LPSRCSSPWTRSPSQLSLPDQQLEVVARPVTKKRRRCHPSVTGAHFWSSSMKRRSYKEIQFAICLKSQLGI
jgi:hypothetical protein